nr:DPP IV N-terminal domain-containing protein [uncultured Carboxylicivirga sp.]
MYKKNTLIIALLLVVLPLCVKAQDIKDRYAKYEAFKNLTKDKVLHGSFHTHWLKDGHSFWYHVLTQDGVKYYLVDASKLKKKEIIDINALLEKVSAEYGDEVSYNDLQGFTVADDIKSCEFVLDGHKYQYSLPSYKFIKKEKYTKPKPYNWTMDQMDQTNNPPVKSPDGKWLAYIKDYNLYMKDLSNETEVALSYDGGLGLYYSTYLQWSPDSKKIMAYLVQPAEKHFVNYIESSPAMQKQPIYSSIQYYKPGDALPQFYPCIFSVDDKKMISSSKDMIPNQYSIENIRWRKSSESLTFEYNKRGHQVYQVIEMNAETGKNSVLINETSPTFIDYSSKHYRFDINDGEEIIWASERDGWNHLYLFDGRTGSVKNQITQGNWVVRNVVKVNPENRTIIFSASGKEAGDPYLIHYYSVGFDGSNLKLLTEGNGNHQISFSADYKYMVDSWSKVDTPPVTVLRDAQTGKQLMTLEEADITPLLANGWKKPQIFSAKGRDGKTDIWGMFLTPSDFDPSKKYPVIEYIYAGPHSSHVPKDFSAYYNRCRQSLAELGFIVVMIDGMGTSNRSKAFHDVCWKNLKDAGFPDRILWMKAAAEKYPFMDISKVGIYGKSAGGQNSTGAVLFHPEFYKVAASICGCHDNRMDKIWWNEQWMGWPIGPEYAECSNVDNAYRLQGDLFLVVGEMDQNVDPTSTYQVVDALIKANKDFDLLTLPGKGHEWGGEYGERRICNFFVEKIMKQTPVKMNTEGLNHSLIKTDIDIDN